MSREQHLLVPHLGYCPLGGCPGRKRVAAHRAEEASPADGGESHSSAQADACKPPLRSHDCVQA